MSPGVVRKRGREEKRKRRGREEKKIAANIHEGV